MHVENIKENVFVRALLSTNASGSVTSQSNNEILVCVNGSIIATGLKNYLTLRNGILVAEKMLNCRC